MTQAYSEEVLVTADWVADHLDEFQSDDPAYRIVEVNSPESVDNDDFPSRYDDGHIPGAIGLQWDDDLADETRRDILDKADFEELLGENGITEDSTVIFYGDGHIANWFACFAYWEFAYYGHDDVRMLDGGKEFWVEEGYPMTDEVPDFTPREYDASGPFEGIRAYTDDVRDASERGLPMVDVRSPEEFSGEVIAPPALDETAQRGGHVPGAVNVPIADVLDDDGTFKDPEELQRRYEQAGVDGDESTITYCRVGERSSIEWFALSELLGYDDVRNYDGSWTEWGNLVRAPIETGPGG